MKIKNALYLLLLLPLRLLAQQTEVTDGPYVRYVDGRVLVANIVKDDDLLIPKTVSYDNKQAVTLNVVPEGHVEWGFTVKLRDTLINDAVSFKGAGKCLFMSDIEGEFVNFRKLLIAAKVIDEHYSWIYGNNTLVIPGDLFDRGKDVVPELWLLYKLEDEAKAIGGRAIILNGNHDIMTLSGDHRYTDSKYFKAAWLLHQSIDNLFDKNTELGRWLRSKNVIDKVGDVLVMHGGMSPAVLNRRLTLELLNDGCRPFYSAPRRIIPDSLQVFFGKDALFWYRGYFMQPKVTMALIDNTLKQYDCKYILVGHTIVKWDIASFYGGKVIGIDVDEHSNNAQAALLENGKWYVVGADGNRKPLNYYPKNDNITDKDIL